MKLQKEVYTNLKEIAKQDEKEANERFAQAYRLIFGDELWFAIGRLYQGDPDAALKIATEVIEKRLGVKNYT